MQQAYVVYQERELPENASPVIPELSAVPSELPNAVEKLRSTAEAASVPMVNFIAKQCMVQGTRSAVCHELSVVDGQQVYRKIDKDGKLGEPLASSPRPTHGVWQQADWTDVLGEVADNPWVFQGAVDNQYLFALNSSPEDDRCYYEEYSRGMLLVGGGRPEWKGPVACFEQVLTDESFNVLSVYTESYPPDNCRVRILQIAIYYDWIKLEGLESLVLLPVRERLAAKVLGQKDWMYTTVSWTDYRKFRAEHKIGF